MKKVLLGIAFLMGASFAAKADLAFLYEGKPLENGAVLNYSGFTYEPILNTDNTPSGFYQFKVDPEIHLMSTTDATVTVTSSSNIAVNLCAGSDCVNGTSNTKNGVVLKANVPLNLNMDWMPTGGAGMMGQDVEVPAIKVVLTASGDGQTISITVNMGGFTADVQTIGAANANSISVSGKTLHYDLPSGSKVDVHSLSGKTVISKVVGGNGSISLAALPKGIYVYNVAGKNGKSGKFIIK